MTAVDRVTAAYARLLESGRPEVWITVRDRRDALAEAEAVDARVAAGADLPLAGLTLAVKDNIDVAGLPTTAACPDFAYDPEADAVAVARLRAAGAIVIGKTNLDQFATGLVGTRSPYGRVRDARRPQYVSGGSSSGSAVAVALGVADLALATDTAGSGRVPAAFQGLVGVKPTRGLVAAAGVVPACRSLDCVTVFAAGLDLAQQATWLMAGPDAADPLSRPWPADAPLAAPPAPRVLVPAAGQLDELMSAEAVGAFDAAAARLEAAGAVLVPVDLTAFLVVGRMLYEGGFVAERHASVGAFVDAHPNACDPTVGAIIAASGTLSASALEQDRERLDRHRADIDAVWDAAGADALLLPTVPYQPTIAEVEADPVGVNARLGTFTNATNLLDRSALAIPAGTADGGCFGVTLIGRAFGDRVLADLAARMLGEPPLPARPAEPSGVPLFVVGAHRTGQPLNHELTGHGARPLGVTTTAPAYRLHALATTPPKPGLVRTLDGSGTAIEGELWAIPPAALGPFLAALPEPMALGRVLLADGREVVGFTCETAALDGAPDISVHRSWPAYLAALARAAP